MITKRSLNNIFAGIKMFILMLLITAITVWSISLYVPWWINRNLVFNLFKYSTLVLTALYLFFDFLLIRSEFRKLKSVYIRHNNRIHVMYVIWFFIKTIIWITILVILFLFMQNTQDFTNITSLFFQDKTIVLFFGLMLAISFLLGIYEFARLNTKSQLEMN